MAQRPIILTFVRLREALAHIHGYEKTYVDTLHDVWKRGAPIPESRLLDVKHYDERKVQNGNFEARLVLPVPLALWIAETATARGVLVQAAQVSAALGSSARRTKRAQIKMQKAALKPSE